MSDVLYVSHYHLTLMMRVFGDIGVVDPKFGGLFAFCRSENA